MSRLEYTAITSLDGYTTDQTGDFLWATPDAEVMAFINDLEGDVGTQLLGRRMYETMVYWETFDTTDVDATSLERDFTEIWKKAEKVVYSTTLEKASSERTRIERAFDPDTVRQLKEAAQHNISIAGPNLASQAFATGLIDDVHLFLTPVVIGGGTSALPRERLSRFELRAVDRFVSGVVHLHYDSSD
jgi:dihydrofolate reductase